MRATITISILLTLLLPADGVAQNPCRGGLIDGFFVERYEVSEDITGFSRAMRLDIVLRNDSDRGVRMIDGSIRFQDVLGRDILRIELDPDHRLDAGATVAQYGIYANTRLLDVAKEDVVITTCIRGLVDSDGEVYKAGGE